MVNFRTVTADLAAAVGDSTLSVVHRNRALEALDELLRRATRSYTSRLQYGDGQVQQEVTADSTLMEAVVRYGVEGMKGRATWDVEPNDAVTLKRSLYALAFRLCQEHITFDRPYKEHEYALLHSIMWSQTVNTHDLLCDNTLWMRYTIPLLDGVVSYRETILSEADQQRQTQIITQYAELLGRAYGAQYGVIKLYLTHVGYAQQCYPVIYELLRGWFEANTALRIFAPTILNMVLTSIVYDAVHSVERQHPDQPSAWLLPLVAALLPPMDDVVQYMIQMKRLFLIRPDERTLEQFI